MGLRMVVGENDGAEECSNFDGIKNVITSEKFCRIYLKPVAKAIDFNDASVHGVFLSIGGRTMAEVCDRWLVGKRVA